MILVGQRYFAALRIPLLQGHIWSADENSRGDFIAVVNHAFATRYLSSSNALGRQLRIPGLHLQNQLQGRFCAKHRLASDHRRRRRCAQRRRRSPRRPRHLPSVHHPDAAIRGVLRPHPGRSAHLPALHPRRGRIRRFRPADLHSGFTAPSPSTKPSSTTHSTAASGSSPSYLASSRPWRSGSRWSASSASSLTA